MKRVTPDEATKDVQNSDALNEMDDTRIKTIRPLIPPQILMEDYPLSPAAAETVKATRIEIDRILNRQNDKLIVVVGPCSIHDPTAALEYAGHLKKWKDSQSKLVVVMRVYFEKPRTTVGWKGLINDPDLDGSFKINKGLKVARHLLLQLNEMGVPCAVEFLDTISPQYFGDLVSWGAIGARTTESQVHRELASGLSCPVGFKNGTDGNVKVAVEAILAANSGHAFLSVTKQGLSAIVETKGNKSCHVILRGGDKGPNYQAPHVISCAESLTKAGLPPNIMIDCSHGNSQKQHTRQLAVVSDIVTQLSTPSGSGGSGQYIVGVMIESNLVEGRQNFVDKNSLVYGQSITDACIAWSDTVNALENLTKGLDARKAINSGS